MICGEKEQKSCNEEKLGCEGCYYSKISEEEKEVVKVFRRMKEMGVKKIILQDAEVIDSQQQWQILQLEKQIEELKKQRDLTED